MPCFLAFCAIQSNRVHFNQFHFHIHWKTQHIFTNHIHISFCEHLVILKCFKNYYAFHYNHIAVSTTPSVPVYTSLKCPATIQMTNHAPYDLLLTPLPCQFDWTLLTFTKYICSSSKNLFVKFIKIPWRH